MVSYTVLQYMYQRKRGAVMNQESLDRVKKKIEIRINHAYEEFWDEDTLKDMLVGHFPQYVGRGYRCVFVDTEGMACIPCDVFNLLEARLEPIEEYEVDVWDLVEGLGDEELEILHEEYNFMNGCVYPFTFNFYAVVREDNYYEDRFGIKELPYTNY